MIHNRLLKIFILLLTSFLLPATTSAEIITAKDYTAEQVPNLQSQTTNSLLVDRDGFIWISNRNGIDRYDGKNTVHYKIGDLEKRGYRDGMMNLLHRDHRGKIWAFTERGIVYAYNEIADIFELVVDLYSLQVYCSVQALFVTDDDELILGLNEGLLCYDLNKKQLLAHVATDCNVKCVTIHGKDQLMVGSNKGMFVYDIKSRKIEGEMLNDLSVICMEPVGAHVWIGTQGNGLYYMPRGNYAGLTKVDDSEKYIVNGLAFAENYGLLIGTDGNGLIQLEIDAKTGLPKAGFYQVAYDNQNAIFPTRSGAINDVMVNHGNVWFTMHMGGCMRLIPNHNLVILTNPNAESPSDNFVYDLDYSPDGHLWVAFNQTLARFDAKGEKPQLFMDHKSRFLTLKVMSDSTVWAGGYGTGLCHFDPRTGEEQWYPSLTDAPVKDNIYDLHHTSDNDLWVAGLNLPLTKLHILPDGTLQKTHYNELTQVFDLESLNKDTLVAASSDGIWLLDVETGKTSHHFLVGEEYAWQGTNFVRCIMTRHGREVWIATAGAGLVCYDVPTDKYRYFDNLEILPSLELRSIVMLNDSMLCASTEDNGVFSFNCNIGRTDRSLLQEDMILQQEFLENSGIRMPNGNILFGGDHGGVMLTPKELIEGQTIYQLFIVGPKHENDEYEVGYRHNNFNIELCTNDVYHQTDYKYEYRVEGWSDDWLPTNVNADGKLHLVNLPAGDWELEIHAVNSTGMELSKVIHLSVNRPIWQRWYAWVAYVFLFFYLVLKIVLYLLRPRIEDM